MIWPSKKQSTDDDHIHAKQREAPHKSTVISETTEGKNWVEKQKHEDDNLVIRVNTEVIVTRRRECNIGEQILWF